MLGLVYILVFGGIVLAIIQATPKWKTIIISLLVATGVIRVMFVNSPVVICHLAVFIIVSLCGYMALIWNTVFDPWIKKLKMM